jgi:DNA-binding transcriptional LysR family regulator
MFSTALPHAIRSFQQHHPHVEISLRELTSREQLYALGERTLDIGVLRKIEGSAPAGIRIDEWYRTPLVVAMPADHPLAALDAVRLVDLRQEGFIMYPREAGTGIYWQVIALCTNSGFRPRVVREVLESSTTIGLVAAGVGIAIVPEDMSCIRFTGVEYKRIQDAGAHSALFLARRGDDRNEHLKSLCRVLKLHARRERGPNSTSNGRGLILLTAPVRPQSRT